MKWIQWHQSYYVVFLSFASWLLALSSLPLPSVFILLHLFHFPFSLNPGNFSFFQFFFLYSWFNVTLLINSLFFVNGSIFLIEKCDFFLVFVLSEVVGDTVFFSELMIERKRCCLFVFVDDVFDVFFFSGRDFLLGNFLFLVWCQMVLLQGLICLLYQQLKIFIRTTVLKLMVLIKFRSFSLQY